MSKFTKLRIMDTFLELLNKKSLDKLTVKDIIETAEVNRNTFYSINEQILKFAQNYPTISKTASSDAPFFMKV